APLPAVREVLSYLSAPCAAQPRLLPARRRGDRAGAVRPLWRAFREQAPRLGLEGRRRGPRHPVSARKRRPLPGGLPVLPQKDARPPSRRSLARRPPPHRDAKELVMARLPASIADLVERYGPRTNDAPPGGWSAPSTPDRLVKTHCCFCGQQCAIQLKV